MPTRRAVLSAALVAGALGGCTTDEPPAAAPTHTPPTPDDPDATLAADALAGQAALLSALDAVVAAHPRRRRALTSTRAVHDVHVRLLGDAVPSGPSPTPPAKSPFRGDDRAAYLAVAAAEDRLELRLRRLAVRADSGPFARVLAAMAAGCAQQAAQLRGKA